jgi:hypothetical protein
VNLIYFVGEVGFLVDGHALDDLEWFERPACLGFIEAVTGAHIRVRGQVFGASDLAFDPVLLKYKSLQNLENISVLDKHIQNTDFIRMSIERPSHSILSTQTLFPFLKQIATPFARGGFRGGNSVVFGRDFAGLVRALCDFGLDGFDA